MGTTGTQILSVGSTGSLMAGKTVPAAPCSDITAIVLDSNTNFVFVADSHGGVCNYAVNASIGDLNPISTTLSPGGNTPVSIAIDPAAEFLFNRQQRVQRCDGLQRGGGRDANADDEVSICRRPGAFRFGGGSFWKVRLCN